MKGVFTILFFFSLRLAAQEVSPFVLRQTIAGSFTDFTVDQLNNIYLLNTGGQLKKLNARGDSIAVFNDVRRYGKVKSMDVTNPLKTLLYFKDFGTVVVLDRFLSRRDALDLRKSGLYQVKSIAQAFDNGYWVFDEQEGKLKHLDEAGTITDQFTDFRLLFDSMPSPGVIIDQNKNLYLYDELKGVYIFDYYGSFRKRVPFTGWKDFLVVNHMFFGRDEDHLYRYDSRTLQLQTYPVSAQMKTALKIMVTTDLVYILYRDRLEICTVKR